MTSVSTPVAGMTEPGAQIAPRLRMRGIAKSFGATVALAGVDIHVASGEVLALIGENGAGKSTLMKVLAGAHHADAGQMWLDETPYMPGTPLDARRRGVAMIYQELSLAPHLSVAENVLLGMEPGTGPRNLLLNWRQMRRKAADALAAVGRPDIPVNLLTGKLPIAEQQLVEVARAVATGCRVLVLDEPTSSLTRRDVEHLFHLVRRLRDEGLAIVYISHFLEEVREVCDRFTVLRDGRSVGGGVTAQVADAAIIAMMVGRSVEDLYPRSKRQRGEVLLETDELAGEGGPQRASLQLHRGEVIGIAGLMGAGRTELLRTIFGLARVRGGMVRVATHLGPYSPTQRWAQGVGMVSEDRKTEGLALSLSVAENLAMSKLPATPSPGALDAAARPWVDRLGIKLRSPRQPVGDLSGGNQQKVAIARLLHHDVDVLLLDEPTRGIDVGAKAQIYRVIDELACRGKAVLLVSSYLPELLGVCDRIAVMCRGSLGPARAVAEVDEHKIMAEAIGTGPSA